MNLWKRLGVCMIVLAITLSLAPVAWGASTYYSSPQSSVWNTYKPSLHYYYQQLSYEEKCAFSSMYDALALGKPDQWNIYGFNLTSSQRQRVQYAIKYDCPELMFADYQFYDFYQSDEILKQTKIIKEYLPKTLKILKKIQKQSNYKGGAFNHQVALDQYIVKNCKYELDNKVHKGNRVVYKGRRAAYSVFVNKVAVCEGYAHAAQFALRYFGVPCLYVYGDADGAHAWNLVQLGGDWYQYDLTWNDANNSRLVSDYMPYFNLTDSLMGRSHTIDREASTYYQFSFPYCYATKWEYTHQKGLYAGSNWRSKIASMVKKAKKAKKKGVGFRFSERKYYNAALSALGKWGKINMGLRRYTYWWIDDALYIYIKW